MWRFSSNWNQSLLKTPVSYSMCRVCSHVVTLLRYPLNCWAYLSFKTNVDCLLYIELISFELLNCKTWIFQLITCSNGVELLVLTPTHCLFTRSWCKSSQHLYPLSLTPVNFHALHVSSTFSKFSRHRGPVATLLPKSSTWNAAFLVVATALWTVFICSQFFKIFPLNIDAFHFTMLCSNFGSPFKALLSLWWARPEDMF